MTELVDSYLAPLPLGELARRLDAAGLLREARLGLDTAEAFTPRHLSYDSRDVTPGSLFFCKGAHFEPRFLAQAVKRGAAAYVAESLLLPDQPDLPALVVSDVPLAMAMAAAWYYEELLKQIDIIGVTGTKGKSTTVYFLKSILDAWMASLGRPASAILSSIDNYDGVVFEESHLTTKESLDLYRHFANAVSSGISHLSMEVSSQALKYHRVAGLPFTVGCFLNFGSDHVSSIEHLDLEDYLSSKLRIFAQSQTACVNLGSAQAERVLAAAADAGRLVGFGWDELADVCALEHSDSPTNSFTARIFGASARFELGLAGDFNVENALAAIAAAAVLGVPLEAMQSGLLEARVPGRMEPFQAPDDKLVLVDYAHNQMSFEALFKAIRRAYPHSYVSIVFGCPGYKALQRRDDLGTISGREADDVVLTEEDAGEEPVEQICADIAAYVRAAGGRPRIILDRQAAIESAIDEAPAGAVILVTGKGRETRQKRGQEYVEVVSDVEIVEEYIRARAGQ